MTAAELDSHVRSVFDFSRSADIDDVEMIDHANVSQISVLRDIVEGESREKRTNEPYVIQFENSSFSVEDLLPLIAPITASTNGTGQLFYAIIEAAIDTAMSITGAKLYHVSSIARQNSLGVARSCRFVRHNDYLVQKDSYFKRPLDKYPIQIRYFDHIATKLSGTRVCELDTIRYPIDIVIDTDTPANNKDPELPDRVMNKVIDRMVQRVAIQLGIEPMYQQMQAEEAKE